MSTAIVRRASDEPDGGRELVAQSLPARVEEARPAALGRPMAASLLPSAEEWRLLGAMATAFQKARMFAHLQSPESFIVVMLKGKELGLPPVLALSSIYLIGGKPMLQTDAMRAIIQRDHGGDALRIVELTDERCTLAYKRREWRDYERCTFTMEDARRAGLTTAPDSEIKNNYDKFPQSMLFSRACSNAARRAFSDSLAGCYAPEDVGVHITEQGDVFGELVEPQDTRQAPPATKTPQAPAPQQPAEQPPAAEQPAAKLPPLEGVLLARNLFSHVATAAHTALGVIVEPLSEQATLADYGPNISDLLDGIAAKADEAGFVEVTEATGKAIATARREYEKRLFAVELPIAYGEAGAQAMLTLLRRGIARPKPAAEGGQA